MSRTMIADLVVNGSTDFHGAVLDAQIRTARNGDFLLLVLTDGVQEIVAKQWQYQDTAVPEIGSIVNVRGMVGEYQGNKDISIARWTPSTLELDLSDFRKNAPQPIDNYWTTIYNALAVVEEPYGDFCRSILKAYTAELNLAPAAVKMHHNYQGGWLEHTSEVLNYAMLIASAESDQYDLNALIVGAVLHDIGKLKTYEWQTIAPVMTDTGQLVEHIQMGVHMVLSAMELRGPAMDPTMQHILHIITSHHGKLEYGSPVLPKSREAFIVHQADILSSQLRMMQDGLSAATGQWTEGKVFPFNRRLFQTGGR